MGLSLSQPHVFSEYLLSQLTFGLYISVLDISVMIPWCLLFKVFDMVNALQDLRIILRAAYQWRRYYEKSRKICSKCVGKTIPITTNGLYREARMSRQKWNVKQSGLQCDGARRLATVAHSKPHERGPLQEYEDRVYAGRLRDDEHQRSMYLSTEIYLN